jgi:hypothetical protein
MTRGECAIADDAEHKKEIDVAVEVSTAVNQELSQRGNVLRPNPPEISKDFIVDHHTAPPKAPDVSA